MTRKVYARITWVLSDAGGRKKIPGGPIYSAPARFEDLEGRPLEEMWSVVIKLPTPNDSLSIITEMWLLSKNAPLELLHPGSLFDIYEGEKHVATGEVLP
jgi:hypothetical protein